MGTMELWTLYAFGVIFTILRTYARLSTVGFRELHVDDYLIWVAIVSKNSSCFCSKCRLTKSLLAYIHSAMQS
jgi:hypothetical protein